MPVLGKLVLVLSASPSRFGAVRAADHLRTVLHWIGAHVLPARPFVAWAHQRLAESVDPELVLQLAEALGSALDVRRIAAESTEPDLLPA